MGYKVLKVNDLEFLDFFCPHKNPERQECTKIKQQISLTPPKRPRFKKAEQEDFFSVLKKRVQLYFETNHLPSHATTLSYLKGALHALCYLLLVACIYSNYLNEFGIVAAYALLGLTKGLIGFNIIHDALHGSFFKSAQLNRWIGYWFDLNGTSSFIWKVSHNVNHHTYTNIPGHDDDIEKAIALRLSPKDKVYWFHRYQNWYAPVLYSLLCFNWVFFSDYLWFFREAKKRHIAKKEKALFFLFKGLNLLLFLLLPLAYIKLPAFAILAGYAAMHMTASITISIVFQLAHIVENVEYFEPDAEGQMQYNWADHEMLTTANFATKNRFVTELMGGLNHQIEHHLFPYVSHTHYPAIATIVRQTAKEYGLPYNESPTFFSALASHFRRLKFLGTWQMPIS